MTELGSTYTRVMNFEVFSASKSGSRLICELLYTREYTVSGHVFTDQSEQVSTHEDCEAYEVARPTTTHSLTADKSYVRHQEDGTAMINNNTIQYKPDGL